MDMTAVKAALQDLLAAMDGEDKRVLQAKLSGSDAGAVPVPSAEAEGEPVPGPCPECGKEVCECGEGGEED